ncbi:GNAT family N-acetyltransferase [Devosia honganensis]|uniref:GNAT family N-acetyltransferase n=1 Tax=Devosia honganensis TaxID=1610527 RepID=A0ABV7X4Z8_9HYPH
MSSLRLPVETSTLRLRPFENGDLDAVARYLTLPSVQRYVERPARYVEDVASSLAVMRKQLELHRPGDRLTLAMVRKADGMLIGHVSLRWSDATAGQGEVRFVIDPTFSGRGYLSEALRALFGIAFDHYHIHRLMVRCDGRSRHSAKLMQTLGMRIEAHYREHALFQGEWDEELHFAMLDREWRPSGTVLDLPRRERVA